MAFASLVTRPPQDEVSESNAALADTRDGAQVLQLDNERLSAALASSNARYSRDMDAATQKLEEMAVLQSQLLESQAMVQALRAEVLAARQQCEELRLEVERVKIEAQQFAQAAAEAQEARTGIERIYGRFRPTSASGVRGAGSAGTAGGVGPSIPAAAAGPAGNAAVARGAGIGVHGRTGSAASMNTATSSLPSTAAAGARTTTASTARPMLKTTAVIRPAGTATRDANAGESRQQSLLTHGLQLQQCSGEADGEEAPASATTATAAGRDMPSTPLLHSPIVGSLLARREDSYEADRYTTPPYSRHVQIVRELDVGQSFNSGLTSGGGGGSGTKPLIIDAFSTVGQAAQQAAGVDGRGTVDGLEGILSQEHARPPTARTPVPKSTDILPQPSAQPSSETGAPVAPAEQALLPFGASSPAQELQQAPFTATATVKPPSRGTIRATAARTAAITRLRSRSRSRSTPRGTTFAGASTGRIAREPRWIPASASTLAGSAHRSVSYTAGAGADAEAAGAFNHEPSGVDAPRMRTTPKATLLHQHRDRDHHHHQQRGRAGARAQDHTSRSTAAGAAGPAAAVAPFVLRTDARAEERAARRRSMVVGRDRIVGGGEVSGAGTDAGPFDDRATVAVAGESPTEALPVPVQVELGPQQSKQYQQQQSAEQVPLFHIGASAPSTLQSGATSRHMAAFPAASAAKSSSPVNFAALTHVPRRPTEPSSTARSRAPAAPAPVFRTPAAAQQLRSFSGGIVTGTRIAIGVTHVHDAAPVASRPVATGIGLHNHHHHDVSSRLARQREATASLHAAGAQAMPAGLRFDMTGI